MELAAIERMHTFCLNCEGKQKTELVKAVDSFVKEGFLSDLIKAVEIGFDGGHKQALESLYEVLFTIHQTGHQSCHDFVLQFVPSLLSIYYVSEIKAGRVVRGKVEALLLTVYNKEVIGQRETPFAKSFRIPSLSKTSVYHEPHNWRASLLTENALSRHEQSDKPVLVSGPYSILSRIPAGYRFKVLETILQEYNSKISAMCEASHVALCKLSIRLAFSGHSSSGLSSVSGEKLIDFDGIAKLGTLPRQRLSSDSIIFLLSGLNFVMHNGLASYAKQALEALRTHCQSLLNAPGYMIVNGMFNSMESAARVREKHNFSFVSNPFSYRRRSQGQSLPKTRKGSRPSISTLTREAKDFVVIDAMKRDELQVKRVTRAVSDSDLRMPQFVPQVKEVNSVQRKSRANTEVVDSSVPEVTTEASEKSVATTGPVNGGWSPSLVVTEYIDDEASSMNIGDHGTAEVKTLSAVQNDVLPKIIIKTELVNSTGDVELHESVPLLVGSERNEDCDTRI